MDYTSQIYSCSSLTISSLFPSANHVAVIILNDTDSKQHMPGIISINGTLTGFLSLLFCFFYFLFLL